jgi:hypothetical protein
MTARIEDFERHRSLLFSIAYRMLGSVADAGRRLTCAGEKCPRRKCARRSRTSRP